MTTLALKRKSKANYEVKSDDLTITVENPFKSTGMGSNAWNITIELDNGNDDDYIFVSEYFDTKKQASQWGADWVVKNY